MGCPSSLTFESSRGTGLLQIAHANDVSETGRRIAIPAPGECHATSCAAASFLSLSLCSRRESCSAEKIGSNSESCAVTARAHSSRTRSSRRRARTHEKCHFPGPASIRQFLYRGTTEMPEGRKYAYRFRQAVLVAEVADAGEEHREAQTISGGDDFGIAL